MEERIKKLEEEILSLKERNKKVEADKAWETSAIRMLSILMITYILASAVMYFIDVQDFLLSALIPTLGYFLSTQSLPFIKRHWISRFLGK